MLEKKIVNETKKRECGECQACCWLYPLSFVGKPAREKCKYQCEKGCAIYTEKRHPVCERFLCDWIVLPEWPDELRPDRAQIIFQTASWFSQRRRLIQAGMYEPESHLRRVNRLWINTLTRAGHLVVCTWGNGMGAYQSHAHFHRKYFPGLTDAAAESMLRSVNAERAESDYSLAT
jgi:hypothetical protein